MTSPAPDTGRPAEEMRETIASLIEQVTYWRIRTARAEKNRDDWKGRHSASITRLDTALVDRDAAEAEAAHLRAENANLRDRVREAEKGLGRDPDGSEPLPTVEPLRVSPASAAAVSRAAPDVTVAEYLKAYEEANGHPLGCRVSYARGWYEFRSAHSSYVFDRKRYAQLVAMTARLRARANDERAQRENAERSSPKDASVVGEAEAPHPLSPEHQEAGDHEPR